MNYIYIYIYSSLRDTSFIELSLEFQAAIKSFNNRFRFIFPPPLYIYMYIYMYTVYTIL